MLKFYVSVKTIATRQENEYRNLGHAELSEHIGNTQDRYINQIVGIHTLILELLL